MEVVEAVASLNEGKAIFASGSPFDPVEYEGKVFVPRQRVGFWSSDEGEEATEVETKSSQNRLHAAESNAAWTGDSVGDNKHYGSQAYMLDDIIDYVKYLQLQVKELLEEHSAAATQLPERKGLIV